MVTSNDNDDMGHYKHGLIKWTPVIAIYCKYLKNTEVYLKIQYSVKRLLDSLWLGAAPPAPLQPPPQTIILDLPLVLLNWWIREPNTYTLLYRSCQNYGSSCRNHIVIPLWQFKIWLIYCSYKLLHVHMLYYYNRLFSFRFLLCHYMYQRYFTYISGFLHIFNPA